MFIVESAHCRRLVNSVYMCVSGMKHRGNTIVAGSDDGSVMQITLDGR
jgi:hypothetical protein